MTCSDQRTVVLSCYECGNVWLKPEDVAVDGTEMDTQSPDHYLEGLNCSIATKHGAHSSTLEEIESAGFTAFIAGKSGSI